jgi:hypothetical protein
MPVPKWLYLASLITFTFGALTFSVLAATYLRERRAPGGGLVFRLFTLACAAAFLANLSLRAAALTGVLHGWTTPLSLALAAATGLLPPLMAHVVYSEERAGLGHARVWRWLLASFYTASAAAALLNWLGDAELFAPGAADWLDAAAPFMLGCAGAAGLVMAHGSRPLMPAQRRHRLWKRGILALVLLCAAANLAFPGGLLTLLPDYLVLAFFCVTLYYTQRLVFFDLLIKRGSFFAVCLAGLTVWFALAARVVDQPWTAALLLTPFWLMGPWIYGRLGQAIDRICLRRRFSPAEADRRFLAAVQAASGEEDLRTKAAASLGEIFQSAAAVRFGAPAAPAGDLIAELGAPDAPLGWIALAERPSGIPFLSDDRRLLESLARTLAGALDNTRFRQQRQWHEERERELRWLASRAELKALRAQINPHFLFNALNAIASLIADQPRLAEETVERLAEVFRYTLRKSDKEWVRLDEEVEFVTAYLEVERARFGDRLAIEFDVAPEAGGVPVPAMSIQPLVENAIKHGVAEVEGRCVAGLRAALEPDALAIEVFDNGPGFPPGFRIAEAPGGHGLRNVAERLRGYYGEAARLWWERRGEWTRVLLRIPRQHELELAGKKRDDTSADRR